MFLRATKRFKDGRVVTLPRYVEPKNGVAMLLGAFGVPVFAVLVSMLEGFLSRRLDRKDLSQEEEDYLNLDVIRKTEEGEYTYPKLKDPTVRE